MKKVSLLIILITLTTAVWFEVQAQQPLTYSLQQAKEYAMVHSFVIKNSGLDVEKARKKVWETIATGLPQVSGTANYTNFLNLAVSLLPAEFFGGEAGTYMPVKFGQDFNSDYGFTVDQLIFDGSYLVGLGSIKIYLRMAQQTKEKSEIEIRNAVTQAYYMALIAHANRIVMQDNLENAQKLQHDTQAMFQNGMVEEQDVDQMKLLVQNADNETHKADREIKISEIVLKYAMGLPVDENILLTDPLEQFLTPLLQQSLEPKQMDFTQHIDHRMLETQRLLTQKAVDLEKATYLPKLSGFMNWSKTAYGNQANLFARDISWYKSSLWGLRLSVPIFSSGFRAAKLNQARIDFSKIENDQQQLSQTLQKDYLVSVSDFENALAQYENTQDNKLLARKILDKTTIKYNSGISSSIEVAQTESQYVQSQLTWVNAVMQLLNARLSYEKATGTL